MLKNSEEVFVVVGLLIATDLMMVDERKDSTAKGVALSIDIGVPGVDASVGPHSRTWDESHSTRYSGDKVLAIQYRSLKLESRRSLQNLLTRVKETPLTLGSYFKGKSHETVL
jgi:hypothetical protein